MKHAPRVAEIVKAALEREPEEWPAFLAEACAGDEGLRAEVASLLQFQKEASAFIEEPALHLAAQSLARDHAGPGPEQIAGYRLLSKIGEGGMGEVYLAEDVELRRRVALKLVRPSMTTAEVVARFRREERILASLNHPNIAQLYGGGATQAGTPFFVMEYVEGARIDEFCRSEALPLRARLALFRKVCAAIQYAHQHLVIHRDLKPSNILVTPEGEPKLLDFGIAKLLDPAETPDALAPTLASVMTPDYASPEQVRGEAITTASDVYSLGVILYELLTAARPYQTKSRSPNEIARAVTEENPRRPSTLAAAGEQPSGLRDRKSLRGDLDNIVLMALRKEPERRYSSVEQFSEDLRRHLEDRPVMARQDTVRYRAGKFARRNKLPLLAAALLLLAIGVGLVATLRQKNRAERRFADVRQLSNALLFEIAPRIERLEGATEARQLILSQSLKYLDSLAQESGRDPALQSELAAAYEKVGELQGNPTNPNLMVLSGALASYQKANAIRRELLAAQPNDPEQRRLLANNHRALGDLFWQTNAPDQSLENSRTALELYTALRAAQPDSMELHLAFARTNYDIGQLLATSQKHAEAIPYFRKVIRAAEELQQPERLEVQALFGDGHRELGLALSWENQQAAGEAEMARALEIYETLAAAHPNDPKLAAGLFQTYLSASSIYETIDDMRANDFAVKTLQVAEQALEKDPANVRARHHLALAYSRMGLTLANIRQPDASIAYLERAVGILHELAQNERENHRFEAQRGLALLRLGDARRQLGNLAKARESLDQAATIFTGLAAGDSSRTDALKNLASIHRSLAETHTALATQATGAEQQQHSEQARLHLIQTRDLFRGLAARDALSEVDRKALAELESSPQLLP